MADSTTHRARLHLETVGKVYPGAWKPYDALRADREALGDWPEYVYCRLAGAYATVSGGGNNRVPRDAVGDVTRLGALTAAGDPPRGSTVSSSPPFERIL